jgi:hypothetical protein
VFPSLSALCNEKCKSLFFFSFLLSVYLCFFFFIVQIDRRELFKKIKNKYSQFFFTLCAFCSLTWMFNRLFCCCVSDFNMYSKDSLVVVSEISTHLVISFLCTVLSYRCSSLGVSAHS